MHHWTVLCIAVWKELNVSVNSSGRRRSGSRKAWCMSTRDKGGVGARCSLVMPEKTCIDRDARYQSSGRRRTISQFYVEMHLFWIRRWICMINGLINGVQIRSLITIRGHRNSLLIWEGCAGSLLTSFLFSNIGLYLHKIMSTLCKFAEWSEKFNKWIK